MIDWKLQSRSHGCQACGKAFADKQSYFTLLLEHRHELVRQDVCAPCWEAKYGKGAKENKEFISFWQGVFNQAPPPPPEAIQKESAETLLRKLTERANPEYAAACFILAVMLERKRILKVKAQNSQNGRRTIIYEHPKTGDVFSIADPDLHLDKLVEVQRTVSHLLENGLPPAVPPNQSLQPASGEAPSQQTAGTLESQPPAIAPVPSDNPSSEIPATESAPAATIAETPQVSAADASQPETADEAAPESNRISPGNPLASDANPGETGTTPGAKPSPGDSYMTAA